MNKEKISYYILLLGIIAIPFDIVWKISVVRVTISEILLSLGIILTLVDVIKFPEKLINKKHLIPVMVFLFACAFSITTAQNKLISIRETIQYIWMAGLFLYILNENRKRNIFYPVVSILIFVSAIVSIAGIYQYFVVREPIHFLITETRLRAHGFYSQPNTLGGFLSGIIPLLLGLYLISSSERKDKTIADTRLMLFFRKKGVILTLLFIVNAGIMATYSRASWIGFIGGLIIMMFFLRKSIPLKRFIIPAAVLCISSAIFLLDISYSYIYTEKNMSGKKSAVNSLFFNRDFSNSQRSMLIASAVSMLYDYPIGGIGIGNFRARLPEYASPELIESMQVDYNDSTRTWFINHNKPIDIELVHNMFLQIIVETGIIGITAFLWILFIFYREAIGRMLAAQSSEDRVVRAAMIASISAILIGGIFGWPFSHGIQEVMIINMALSVSQWS
jgi:putative inorganic carbon (HCO3(-)) transporter